MPSEGITEEDTAPVRRRFPARLWRCCRGVTAIEFALIFPVFALLLIGTLEVALMFIPSTVVEGAVAEAGRRVRTGQIQEEADPVAAFETAVCAALSGIRSCSSLTFDVRSFSSFSTVSMPIEYDEDDELITEFNTGGTGDIVAVRVIYYYQFYTPMMGQFFGDSAGTNRRLMASTAVFRNEPY